MIFSITVLLYFLILQLLANNSKYYIKLKLSYYTIFFSFIFLNFFRIYCQSIFPDTSNYEVVFKSTYPLSHLLTHGHQELTIEFGFSLFISFFKLFSSNFEIFLFFISTIQLSIFYTFCKKLKISLVNAFPIYISLTFLTFQIGMLRQALAFCFFLLALIYINRKVIYLLLIFIGFMFHRSILFCIFLIWSDKLINRKILYVVIFSSLVLYLLKIDIIEIIYSFIENYIPQPQKGRIDYYLMVDRPNNYLGIGFWERVILLVLMNVAYTDLLKKDKINEVNNLIYNLGTSVILLQMIFFASPTITSRLRYYIVIFPAIFLAEYFYSEQKNKLKWLYQSLLFIYLFLYLRFQASYLQ